VAEVLNQHVVLEVECIDRMYLNVIVSRLQILEGARETAQNNTGYAWILKSSALVNHYFITDGVIRSLHIDYDGTRIKQYHMEGQALRTEDDHQQHPRLLYGKEPAQSVAPKENRLPSQPSSPAESIAHECVLTEEVFQ